MLCTVTKGQASLCKCANSPEPSLQAHAILVFIALSSDYMAHVSLGNVQTHQSSLSSGENSTQIAEIACAGSRCDLRAVYVSSEGFGGSSPATTAHLCNNRCVV